MGRIKQPIGGRRKIIYGVAGIAILCSGYEVLSYRQHLKNSSDTTIPNATQLWKGFKQICEPRENTLKLFLSGEEAEEDGLKELWRKINTTWLFNDVWATYGRLVKGLVWGCLASVVLGIAMGCYERIGSFFLPILAFLAKVPGTAMLAVFFVIVGTGETMFISMIGFGVLPTLAQAVYASTICDVHEEQINKAYTLGASNMEVIYNIVYKTILPRLLESVRLQIGPAMVYLIAAEMLVGQVGMGYQIRMQQRLLNMSVVYDYLLILGVTGLLLDRAMLWFRRWLCPWFSRSN